MKQFVRVISVCGIDSEHISAINNIINTILRVTCKADKFFGCLPSTALRTAGKR